MRWHFFSGASLIVFSIQVAAEYLPADHYLWGPKGTAGATLVQKRQAATATASRVADPACTNGPLTRQCWLPGYSVATDFDEKWPTTGRTVTYDLELRNTTCNPDGNAARPCQLFNGQYPGPTITANWGDMIQINVKNSLAANGTSVHWHGIRQLNTVTQDGVNGITECPLAPGQTKTYKFLASQFGTTWYHSHFSAQYGEGASGPIVINGPASANYDIDLGPYPVTDWYYKTAFQTEDISDQLLQSASPPPPGDTILVNGTNKNPNGGGSYAVTSLTKGKKHLLRIINTSVDNTIRVALDGHQFTVITADLVPIKPYTTDWILLAVGQRYEVIINANQTADNYWFRAVAAPDCASGNRNTGQSIFRYTDAPSTDPTSSGTSAPTVCRDEPSLVPWVPNTVPSASFSAELQSLNVDITREQVSTNNASIVVWTVNTSAIDIAWSLPTLAYVAADNASYPRSYNVLELPTPNTWTFWVIQETPGTPVPIPHPIHLHGHDFYVLGSGAGVFVRGSSAPGLLFQNPVRRDTALLPAGGWLVLAFPTDNPGAWLMHCHIAWHVSQGLGVQFLERKAEIGGWGGEQLSQCEAWRDYERGAVYKKQDSGL